MSMKKTHRQGSALVLVMVASMFLIILTAGAFRYFQTNVHTYSWTKDRIQAKLAAEAGVNLAAAMLINGAQVPAGNTPEPIIGTATSFSVLPGNIGTVFVTIDPSKHNADVIGQNAFMIRCIARIPGRTDETFGIESIVLPKSMSNYAMFLANASDDPKYQPSFYDGDRIDGPFHCNGGVRIGSSDNTDEHDPYFYSFSTGASYYHYINGVIGSRYIKTTTPSIGRLNIRPVSRMQMGDPYMVFNAPVIPFGPNVTDWKQIRDAAINGGLYLTNTDVPRYARLVIKGDTLLVRPSKNDPVDIYPLGDLANKVIWIEQPEIFERFSIRTHPDRGLSIPLTLGTNGGCIIRGPFLYENMDFDDAGNDDLFGLALVSEGSIWNGSYYQSVSIDLGMRTTYHEESIDWGEEECWDYDCERSFTFCGVMLFLDCSLGDQNFQMSPMQDFQHIGAYLAPSPPSLDDLPMYNTGHKYKLRFDPRLFAVQPPFFPSSGTYDTSMWREVPDISTNDVELGIPEF